METILQIEKQHKDHICTKRVERNEDPTKNKVMLCKGVDMPKSLINKINEALEPEIKDLKIVTWIALNLFIDQADAFHGIINYRVNNTATGHRQHRFSGILNLEDSELNVIKSKEILLK